MTSYLHQFLDLILTVSLILPSFVFGSNEAVTSATAPPEPLRVELARDFRAVPLPTNLNPRCHQQFITPEGTYGELAVLLKKNILGQGTASNQASLFFNDGEGVAELAKYCPRFATMSDDEKLAFWIWTFAIISNAESGCNVQSRPNRSAPNGIAIGAFQTPQIENGQSPAWRGPGCAQTAQSGPYRNAPYQAACAVEIMAGHLSGFYGRPKFPTAPGSHWEVIMGMKKHAENRYYFREYIPCGYRGGEET